MAQRRMFNKEIMELDDFVDMPVSTKLLYVYINLSSDDEGFLGSPKKVMRAFGGSEDDIKILIAKGFLIKMESGVIVIKHWHEHNQIRKDRIKNTRFLDEKQQLSLVESTWQPNDNQVSTSRQPNVRIGKVSIGKDSIVKDSIGKVSKEQKTNPKGYELISFTENEMSKLRAKYTNDDLTKIFDKLENYKLSSGKQYKSDYGAIGTWVAESIKKDNPVNDKAAERVNSTMQDVFNKIAGGIR